MDLNFLTTIKWLLSVFICGIMSLRFLQNPEKKIIKQETNIPIISRPPFGYASPKKNL